MSGVHLLQHDILVSDAAAGSLHLAPAVGRETQLHSCPGRRVQVVHAEMVDIGGLAVLIKIFMIPGAATPPYKHTAIAFAGCLGAVEGTVKPAVAHYNCGARTAGMAHKAGYMGAGCSNRGRHPHIVKGDSRRTYHTAHKAGGMDTAFYCALHLEILEDSSAGNIVEGRREAA